MLRPRLRAADPPDLGRSGVARRPRARGRRREPLRSLRRVARRRRARRGGDPSRRPRALPLLRGARPAIRRARHMPPSRSTTSAGRRAPRSATTTSSTCPTCSRRRRTASRPTSRACVAQLRAAGCTSIFTVGFCFGGRNSWLAAASGHGLAGAIGFYGRPGPGGDGSPDRCNERRRCGADPRAHGRRRPRDPGRGRGGVRRGARRLPASSTRS